MKKRDWKMKLRLSPSPPPPSPSPSLPLPSSSSSLLPRPRPAPASCRIRPRNALSHAPPPSLHLSLCLPPSAAALRRPSLDVEAEIYDFMLRSPNPHLFPSKSDLLAAGREDLVHAVAREGGWLAFGWDAHHLDERLFQARFDGSLPPDQDQDHDQEFAGCSGRKLDMSSSGIERILNGLKKERSLSFDLGSVGTENRWCDISSLAKTAEDIEMGGQCSKLAKKQDCITKPRAKQFGNRILPDFRKMIHSPDAESWRAWSYNRASAYGRPEFEATCLNLDVAISAHNSVHSTAGSPIPLSRDKKTLSSHVHLRLQQLKEELASTLKYVRFERAFHPSSIMKILDNQKSSQEELYMLSDTWEFQQTEIMKTRDNLRSIRARLSVLEGKMTMGIIESQKLLEEKQKKINDAKKAFRLLRTVCIVWANSASEVLLAGSFDGWTRQRKMERSGSGIFILNLKLFPGSYEIKFVVDGIWMVDPLRPISSGSGFENNLLIVP